MNQTTKEVNNEELASLRSIKAYEESRTKAAELVNDPDKLSKFLDNLEEKFKEVPKIGAWLANIPILVEMVRSYINGEYRQLPIGTIIGVVTALIYFINPFDLIPDTLPGVGHIDDAMVIAVTVALVSADIETYKQWREKSNNTVTCPEAEIK